MEEDDDPDDLRRTVWGKQRDEEESSSEEEESDDEDMDQDMGDDAHMRDEDEQREYGNSCFFFCFVFFA